jgi:acyl-CoA dehydrogenase
MKSRSSQLESTFRQIDDFMREEVYALERDLLQGDFEQLMPALAVKREAVKRLGLWTPHLPRENGGLGLSLADFGRVSELLGRSPLGHYLFNCQAPDIGNMEILMHYGTGEQQDRFLEPLLQGAIRSCFAMTEPARAGSNPIWLETTAVREGDDYVIDGRKWFATAADGAAFAIVMALTDPTAESPYRRASQIIVPSDTTGYRHLRRIRLMGEEGKGFFSHSELLFDHCRVPVNNRLGSEGAGFALAQERLGPGRIHHTMRWIGICERALAMMCERVTNRELSPGRSLAGRQAVQHWLAESRAEINAARLLVLDAAHRIDRDGARAARIEISTIKFFVAGVLQRVLDRAIQVHGALGMTDDTVLSFWYRHERAARIYDGPDEVHKSVVARHMLRPYGVNVEI